MAQENAFRSPWVWALVGMVIVVLAIWAGFAIWGGEDEAPTVFEIRDEPGDWIGESVTVGGEINEVLARDAFTMGQSGSDEAGILVLMREGAAAEDDPQAEMPFRENDLVLVTGEVRWFEPEDLTAEGLAVETEILGDFQEQPVVVAETVDLTNRPD